MSEQTIFSKPYGSVLVDASVPCITTQWHAFANAEEFIALMTAATVYFEAHSTPERPWGWVGDVRHMSAIPAKAQAWLISEFNSRATAAGLREMSVVVAANVFGQVAAKQYVEGTAQARDKYVLHTHYYDSPKAAKAGVRAALAGE